MDNEQLIRTRALFKRVFCTPDGTEVIKTLLRMTRMHPKTDLEYAKAAGMQSVLNMILDISEFFGDIDDGR